MRIDINMDFPECISMEIQYNDHLNCCETAEECIEITHIRKFISDHDYKKCVELNTIWSICWYPTPPLGFHPIYSYSIERCLEILRECQNAN